MRDFVQLSSQHELYVYETIYVYERPKKKRRNRLDSNLFQFNLNRQRTCVTKADEVLKRAANTRNFMVGAVIYVSVDGLGDPCALAVA